MNTKRGVISTIVLIVVALIILGYFHISFKSIVSSPTVQENLKFAWQIFMDGLTGLIQWIKDTIHTYTGLL